VLTTSSKAAGEGHKESAKEITMEQKHLPSQQQPEEDSPAVALPRTKAPWQEPKLAFVEPKLTPHGELKHVTGAFFGTFTP
jgi:hypothetical protein